MKSRGGPTDNLQMLNGNHADKHHRFVLCEVDMILTFDIHLGVSPRDLYHIIELMIQLLISIDGAA